MTTEITPEAIAALLDGVTHVIEGWENQAGGSNPVGSQTYEEARADADARDLAAALRDALTVAQTKLVAALYAQLAGHTKLVSGSNIGEATP